MKYYEVTITDQVRALLDAHDEAFKLSQEKGLALRDEIGARDVYVGQQTGQVVAVKFGAAPDMSVYKSVRDGYFPRRNTNAGRDMFKRFKSVPKRPVLRECGVLELFGAEGLHMLHGMTLRRSSVVRIPGGPLYIGIPKDDTPLAILEDMEPQPHVNSFSHLAKWTPPEGLREVREWEVRKAIDEHNFKVKE